MNHLNFIKRFVRPKTFFMLLVFFSVLVMVFMLFPNFISLLGDKILIIWGLLALSGVGLVIVTCKAGINGRIKVFLLVSGYSAGGFLVGVVFHNMFYALRTLTGSLALVDAFLGFLEVGFFIVAVILCPLGLLVGIAGVIISWKRFPDG